MRPQREGEGCKLRERRLLGDAGYMCSVFAEMDGYGKQQWAGACDHDAFALNGKSAFDERLQTTRSEDSGQGPTGEGKESLTGSGGQDETFVAESYYLCVAGGFVQRLKGSRGRRIEDTVAGEKSCTGGDELFERAVPFCVLGFVRVVVGGFDPAAPDLSPGVGVVVEQKHTSPVPRSGSGSRDAGWSGAHDDDISLFHCSDSTTMPSLQVN